MYVHIGGVFFLLSKNWTNPNWPAKRGCFYDRIEQKKVNVLDGEMCVSFPWLLKQSSSSSFNTSSKCKKIRVACENARGFFQNLFIWSVVSVPDTELTSQHRKKRKKGGNTARVWHVSNQPIKPFSFYVFFFSYHYNILFSWSCICDFIGFAFFSADNYFVLEGLNLGFLFRILVSRDGRLLWLRFHRPKINKFDNL